MIGGQEVFDSGDVLLQDASFRGCDSIVHLTIDFIEPATYTLDPTLCPGESVVVNGVTYDENDPSGQEILTGASYLGCDSIVDIDLSFGSAVIVDIDESICPGGSITVGGVVFDESNTPFEETIVGGSQAGCDSITYVDLTIYPQETGYLYPTLCPGENMVVDGVVIDANNLTATVSSGDNFYGCDSTTVVEATMLTVPDGNFETTLCAGESITINGTVYDENNPSGAETIPQGSFQECDTTFTVSIQFYDLSVNNLEATLCTGETLVIGGSVLSVDNPTDTIVLPGGSFTGCDSIVMAAVDFLPVATELLDNTLCFGQMIEVNGTIYDESNPSGQEIIDEGSYLGCDSIITVDLNFNSAVMNTIDDVFCDSTDMVIVNGTIYNVDNPSGEETIMEGSVSGCDSVITVALSYPGPEVQQYNDVLCAYESLSINGTTYDMDNPSGSDIIAGGSTEGCDVLIEVDLSFFDPSEIHISETICPNENVLIEGIIFHENHTTDTLIIPNGGFTNCDSFVFIQVNFYEEVVFELTENLCEGQEVIVNNTVYNEAMPQGIEVIVGGSYTGCDSTVIVDLTYDGVVMENFNPTLCEGESTEINGITYDENNPTGLDTIVGGSYTGCDSVLNVAVNFINHSHNNIDTTLCSYGSLVVNGVTYDADNPSGTELLPGMSYTSCDSIIQVDLSFHEPAFSDLTDQLCPGESLMVHGILFDESQPVGDVVLDGQSYTGCDSIIHVQLSFYPLSPVEEVVTICEGETYLWNGNVYESTGIYSDTLFGQSINGCDSLIGLDLTVLTADMLGLADAGPDFVSCDGIAQLSANQPSGTTGLWTIMEGVGTIDDPASPTTTVNDLESGGYAFVWTLSSDVCPNYHSDTVFFTYIPHLDAEDDLYTVEEGVLTTPLDLPINDNLHGMTDWYIEIPDLPPGILEDLGDGLYDYTVEESLLGTTISFIYLLCSEECPDHCDTAMVRIEFPELPHDEFPNTITPNGDGTNDFFVIPDLEDNPGQYTNPELIVFNRWGDVVYSDESYQNNWGGTSNNGKELPEATYYYIIRVNIGEGVIYRGDITILR